MADESNNQTDFKNIGLVILALLLAITTASQLNIIDPRPERSELPKPQASSGKAAYAQLWQDPFQAVDRFFIEDACTKCAKPGSAEGGEQQLLVNVAVELKQAMQTAAMTTDLMNKIINKLKQANDLINKCLPDEKTHETTSLASLQRVVPRRSCAVAFFVAELKTLDQIDDTVSNLENIVAPSNSGNSSARVEQTDRDNKSTRVANSFERSRRATDAKTTSQINAEILRSISEIKGFSSTLRRAIIAVGNELPALQASIADADCPTVQSAPPWECVGPNSLRRKQSLKIMAVIVNSGSSASLSEFRQRQRYGIVSAMEASGYRPDDSNQIHITQMQQLLCPGPGDCPIRNIPLCQNTDQRGCVPFDRFTLNPVETTHPVGLSDAILVLWLRDDAIFDPALADTPALQAKPLNALTTLQKIAENVYPKTAWANSAMPVIGPSNSLRLEQLHDAVEAAPFQQFRPPCSTADESTVSTDCPYPGDSLHIYDVEATEALRFETIRHSEFLSDPEFGEKFRFPECVPISNQRFCFSRTGAADSGLSEVLVSELRSRIASNGPGRVVLFTDMSSPYADSLAFNITNEMTHQDKESEPNIAVTTYNYFPGVDGHFNSDFGLPTDQKPQQASSSSSSHGSAISTSALVSIDADTPAEGYMQLDYLRRIGNSLKLSSDRRPIEAVGIIGSDIYDKLMIIETLRPMFPRALMFTTDFDAQMDDASVLKRTAGLVVASNFSLHPPPMLIPGYGVPEFRDQITTAMFLTGLYVAQCDIADSRLLRGAQFPEQCQNLKAVVDPLTNPFVFQIGRSGEVHQLTRRKASGLPPIYENLTGHDRVLIWIVGASTILAARILHGVTKGRRVLAILANMKPWTRARAKGYWATVFCIGVLSFVLLCWPYTSRFLTQQGFGEELGWMDGLSLWPVVWLQIMASILAIWFIMLVFSMANRNTIVLATYFGLGSERETWLRLLNHRLNWSRDVLMLDDSLHNQEVSNDGDRHTFCMQMYWNHYYVGRGSLSARGVRSSAYALLIAIPILFCYCYFPNDPIVARGSLVKQFYYLSFWLSSAFSLILVGLVFDATINASHFIRYARQFETVWPEESRTKFQQRLGFGGTPLSEWMDIEFTAVRTEIILRLVWFPFLILALLCIAHWSGDRLLETGFLAFVSVSSIMLLLCVIILRLEAERQRESALGIIEQVSFKFSIVKRIESALTTDAQDDITQAQADLLATKLQALRQGSFASIMQQPFVKAILLPIGAAAWPIIQSYTNH